LNYAEYNPNRFPGIIFRQYNPRATFLIFSTGKMVITGLEQAKDASIAVSKLLKKLKKVGIKANNPEIIIQNLVANGDLHMNLNLNKASLMMESVMFEPEVFPGLIYNMKNPRAVFLLFSTGKFVCTGVKDKRVLKEAILKLKRDIKNIDITSNRVIEKEYELTFL
jgi:transcription initiation factor TFIID TATA-box-binding protein